MNKYECKCEQIQYEHLSVKQLSCAWNNSNQSQISFTKGRNKYKYKN